MAYPGQNFANLSHYQRGRLYPLDNVDNPNGSTPMPFLKRPLPINKLRGRNELEHLCQRQQLAIESFELVI